MSTLIILRGNSGSGKTTTARRLQRALGRGTLVIPQDTVRREMLWAHDGVGSPAIPLLTELAKYGSEHCEFAILEGILDAQVYEPLFRAATEAYDRVFAYYYDIPFEETLRRHETKPNRADFGPEHMRRWWKEKDYIGWLPEKIIPAELSQEDTVNMILSDIGK